MLNAEIFIFDLDGTTINSNHRVGGGSLPSWFKNNTLENIFKDVPMYLSQFIGILDNLNVGLGRSKGIGQTRQVMDGYLKFLFLKQKTTGLPISLVYTGSIILPYQPVSTDSTSVASYPTFLHRFTFNNQIHIARKFNDRLSIQLNFGVNHRNYVNFADKNTLVFLGGGVRFRMTKNLGIIVEYHHVLNRDLVFHQNPLSVGVELLTGGHAFTFGYSNGRGVTENLFIPNTTANWLNGEFRLGFGINRRFKL